jgi:hypothetical protein
MLQIGEKTGKGKGPSRRALVQAGFMSALGLSLPQQAALAAAQSRRRSVILLWMWGGPPHLDTFDPKPNAPLEYRGPYRAIDSNVSGIQVTELLPHLARRAHRYSLIRTLSHSQVDHGVAGTVQMTGVSPLGGRVYPHAGSIVSRIRGFQSPLSSFVTVGDRLQQGHRTIQGEGGGYLGAVYDPFRLNYDVDEGVILEDMKPPDEVGLERAFRRRELLNAADVAAGAAGQTKDARALDRFYNQAFSLMTSGEGRKVFALESEPAKLRDAYGRNRFGQSCLLARRLVEAGVSFVQVNWSQHVEAEEDAGDGGWDNHYRNFEMLAERQCWPFDQACSALLDDLADRGLLNDTAVVAVGEFGRSPKINAQAGRDHWPQCYSALVAGGGFRGGQVVGASDDRGEYPASRLVKPSDLCLSMLEAAGITRTDILALGLPVDGEPIHELL